MGSGSKGNCIYVGCNNTNILIDMGLPIRRIEKSLAVIGVNPSSVSVLITHEHSDHIKTTDAFVKKYGSSVYAHEACREGICRCCDLDVGEYVFFGDDDSFYVGELSVAPFNVSHDVPCVGYSIEGNGKKLSVATDIGKVTPSVLKAIIGSDLVVLESNHDRVMLEKNAVYPRYLKNRISSGKGHLSNDDCALTIRSLVATGTKQVVLAHLSEENNCPELAFETVKRVVEEGGYVEGKDIKIEIAEQDRLSSMFEIS